MSNRNSVAYSQRGSKTTKPISEAPYSVQLVWRYANSVGAAIVRVKEHKIRYEHTSGKTFDGMHQGHVSVYTPIKNPTKKLWFKKLLGIAENNSSMQIFEVPKGSFDLSEVVEVINQAEVYGG